MSHILFSYLLPTQIAYMVYKWHNVKPNYTFNLIVCSRVDSVIKVSLQLRTPVPLPRKKRQNTCACSSTFSGIIDFAAVGTIHL